MRRNRPYVIALALALAASGCYKLTPIDGTIPEPGLEVRLALSDAGSVKLAPLVGPRIDAIDGRAMESNDSAFVVAVHAVVSRGGRSMAWSMERVSVPRTAVSSIRMRTLDRKKSWLAAALTVFAALAAADAFGLGGAGFDGLLGGGSGGKK